METHVPLYFESMKAKNGNTIHVLHAPEQAASIMKNVSVPERFSLCVHRSVIIHVTQENPYFLGNEHPGILSALHLPKDNLCRHQPTIDENGVPVFVPIQEQEGTNVSHVIARSKVIYNS